MKVFFVLGISLLSFNGVLAQEAPPVETEKTEDILIITEKQRTSILAVYEEQGKQTDIGLRAGKFSELFLGQPYEDYSLGEGEAGEWDRDPRWRLDCFDCTTYVEQVMALAISETFEDFQENLDQIRYKDGVVSFKTRNHFTSGHWIPNNIAAGFVIDVTDHFGKTEVLTATLTPSKWYGEKVKGAQGQLKDKSKSEDFQKYGADVPDREATIQSLSVDVAFDVDRNTDGTVIVPEEIKLNSEFVEAFSVNALFAVSIVKKLSLVEAIGSDILVTHQVFIFKNSEGEIIVRHASSKKGLKKVMDVPFVDYMWKYVDKKKPSTRGINILKLVSPVKASAEK